MSKNNDQAIAISVPIVIIFFCFFCLICCCLRNRRNDEYMQLLVSALDNYRRLVDEQVAKKEEIHRALQAYETDLQVDIHQNERDLEAQLAATGYQVSTETVPLSVSESSEAGIFDLLRLKIAHYPQLPNNPNLSQINEIINQRQAHHEETVQLYTLFLQRGHNKLKKISKESESFNLQ